MAGPTNLAELKQGMTETILAVTLRVLRSEGRCLPDALADEPTQVADCLVDPQPVRRVPESLVPTALKTLGPVHDEPSEGS